MRRLAKKRTWFVVGHRKGVKEKDRTIGSVRYVGEVSMSQALKRAKRDYPNHTITGVS